MNRHKVGQILPTLQVAGSGAHNKENERERERRAICRREEEGGHKSRR